MEPLILLYGVASTIGAAAAFTLHGQTQNITANARIQYMPLTEEMRQAYVNGDVVLVQARFKVKLADHGVSIPPPVRLKVAEEVTVSVVLRAVM